MTATWRDWAKAVGLRNRLSEAVSGFTPSCLCWRKAVSRQRRLRTPISDRLFRLDAGFALLSPQFWGLDVWSGKPVAEEIAAFSARATAPFISTAARTHLVP